MHCCTHPSPKTQCLFASRDKRPQLNPQPHSNSFFTVSIPRFFAPVQPNLFHSRWSLIRHASPVKVQDRLKLALLSVHAEIILRRRHGDCEQRSISSNLFASIMMISPNRGGKRSDGSATGSEGTPKRKIISPGPSEVSEVGVYAWYCCRLVVIVCGRKYGASVFKAFLCQN